jgi:hypothetical protein
MPSTSLSQRGEHPWEGGHADRAKRKGGLGIDGIRVGELPEHLRREWVRIREEFLAGTYRPQPVKRQTIPKAGRASERWASRPCWTDSIQALLQFLQPRIDRDADQLSSRGARDCTRRPQRHLHEPPEARAPDGGLPPRKPYDPTVGRWATAALEAAFANAGADVRPVRIRMMGGTEPRLESVTPLTLPFVIVPLVNADNNQHFFDENLWIGSFVSGMRKTLGLLLKDYRE